MTGWLARLAARELGLPEDDLLDVRQRQVLVDGRRVDLTPRSSRSCTTSASGPATPCLGLNCSAPSGAMRTNSAPTWSMAVIHTSAQEARLPRRHDPDRARRRLPAVPLNRATRPLLNDVDSKDPPSRRTRTPVRELVGEPFPLLGQDPPIHRYRILACLAEDCSRIGHALFGGVARWRAGDAQATRHYSCRRALCSAWDEDDGPREEPVYPRFPAAMVASAPGRTRTCNLLFRRCLSPDAVQDREVAGHRRPWSESYRVVGSSRAVTLSSENALSRFRACPHPIRGVRRSWVAHGRSCVDGQSSAPVVDAVVPIAPANSFEMATTSVRNRSSVEPAHQAWGGDPGRMPSCMTRLSVSGPPQCSACLPS